VQFFRDLHQRDPAAADRLARAMTNMPGVGDEFLGFRLRAELGRGAFARVYLAQQGELANRPVVVKVAADVFGEAQTLAQLRHPNIVPVYSVHRSDPFQAVCMPFQGSTTLQDLLEAVQRRGSVPASGKALLALVPHDTATGGTFAETLARLSYVEAVVEIAARLADGLAHAHERGIIHRDLKPANVLFADNWQPLLLDFNVAEDMKLRCGPAAVWVAGTLPYMAPEQLASLQSNPAPADARGDLYAFGVLLYEMLTGRYPFMSHDAASPALLDRALQERRGPAPTARGVNPAVPAALDSIVRRCLEPDPHRRYQTARQMQEDLERQRTHRPLRHAAERSLRGRLGKWVRRYPRLVPAASVAGIALAVLAALALAFGIREHEQSMRDRQQQEQARRQLEREQALAAFQQFEEERKTALFFLYTRMTEPEQLDEGVAAGSRFLDRYDVLSDPGWQQSPQVLALPEVARQQLAEDMGELLLLVARAALWRYKNSSDPSQVKGLLENALVMNERAADCAVASAGLWRQRGELWALLGQEARAEESRAKAADLPLRTTHDHYFVAGDHIAEGRLRDALPLLQEAARREPQNFWAWFTLANGYDRLGMDARAEGCYDACLALWPRFHWAHFNRGLAYFRQQDYLLACADFDETIRLRPDLADAYLNRALARQGLNQLAEAEQDFTEAMDRGGQATRLHFLRSRVREKRGDKEGARRDYQEGLRREPADEKSWLARGFANLSTDPEAALADFEQALRLNPRSLSGLQNKAHVLAEKLGRNREALDVLDRAVELYPDSAPLRGGRGVLLARFGRRDAALRDGEEALLRDPGAARVYQVACIYALTSANHSDDRLRAFQLLSSALRKGYGLDLLDTDHDLDALRSQPEFRRLTDAARALRASQTPKP
jgi:tetratricopeptide (TPR) repeat protein